MVNSHGLRIQTVRGDIGPEALGITLAHEHLLIDVTCRWREPTDPYLRQIADRPVEMGILGDLHRNPSISKDSLRLSDVDLAIEELRHFKEAGGQALLDHTSRWIGADPLALRRIAEATGLHIVAGCGYYSPVLPPNVEELTIDDLADSIVRDVTAGLHDTDVRAGFIGEIGTNWPLSPPEIKFLRAGARAQVRTGAALSIHVFPWERAALPILEILESEGADLGRVVICHLDHLMDLEYHKMVAARGAYVEYDRFGVEWYSSLAFSLRVFPRDVERVAGIIELIRSGYGEQILISQDVCQKIELKKYGGHGYGHILRYVVPLMRQMGIAERDIQTILVDNPRRLLAF
jgi:phosphotriesterase-related protein